MIKSNLYTLSEIARREGFTHRQCDYVCRNMDISPTRRVGIIRMFSEDKIKDIRNGLMNLRNYG